jgi:hypothetical protein
MVYIPNIHIQIDSIGGSYVSFIAFDYINSNIDHVMSNLIEGSEGRVFQYYDSSNNLENLRPNSQYQVYSFVYNTYGNRSMHGPISFTIPLPPSPVITVEKVSFFPSTVNFQMDDMNLHLIGNIHSTTYFAYEIFIVEDDATINKYQINTNVLQPAYSAILSSESTQGVYDGFNDRFPSADLQNPIRIGHGENYEPSPFVNITKRNHYIVKATDIYNQSSTYIHTSEPERQASLDIMNVTDARLFIFSDSHYKLTLTMNPTQEHVIFYMTTNFDMTYDDVQFVNSCQGFMFNSTESEIHTFMDSSGDHGSLQTNASYTVYTQVLNRTTGEFYTRQSFNVSTHRNISIHIMDTRTSTYGVHFENTILSDNQFVEDTFDLGVLLVSDALGPDSADIMSFFEDHNPLTAIFQRNININRNAIDEIGVYTFLTTDTLLHHVQLDINNKHKFTPLDLSSNNVMAYIYKKHINPLLSTLFQQRLVPVFVFPELFTPSFVIESISNDSIFITVNTGSDLWEYFVLATSELISDLPTNGFYINQLLNHPVINLSTTFPLTTFYNAGLNSNPYFVYQNTYYVYILRDIAKLVLFRWEQARKQFHSR